MFRVSFQSIGNRVHVVNIRTVFSYIFIFLYLFIYLFIYLFRWKRNVRKRELNAGKRTTTAKNKIVWERVKGASLRMQAGMFRKNKQGCCPV